MAICDNIRWSEDIGFESHEVVVTTKKKVMYMKIYDYFNSDGAPLVRKIVICIGLIAPAMLFVSIILIGIVFIDYKHDPGREIGLLGWASWSFLCGVYLKSKGLKIVGIITLFWAIFEFLTH